MSGPGFPMAYVTFFYVRSVEARSDCLCFADIIVDYHCLYIVFIT
jgi:hypothetical protein